MVLDEAGVEADDYHGNLHSQDPWYNAVTFAAVHLLVDVLGTDTCEASGIIGRGAPSVFYGRRRFPGNALAIQIADAVKRKLGRLYVPTPHSRSDGRAE